jgi:pimeloyl-ACP methyl ester carboxylesterase
MNTQSIGSKVKAFGTRKLACIFLVIVLLLPACTRQSQPARVEEITFQSGEFTLVGDLRTPAGTGPFPIILFVHGDGPFDRTMFGYYIPIMERMLRAGNAVFSWDKQGTGESTGQLSDTRIYHQRAQILLDAIEVMKSHPDIAPQRIGLWGISQASYVMPLALSMSEDIAFMICVSCGGMSGNDEMVYLITKQSICAGVPEEQADELKRLLSELDRTRTYETYAEYVNYRETLDELAGIGSHTPDYSSLGVIPEEAWQANDPEIENWWNPVEVIKQTKIPVLAIFGDRDPNGDPIQGAYAWRKALEQAGNPNFRVELLPGVGHIMEKTQTGCLEEQAQTFEQVLQDQGYGSLEETLALVQRESGQHTPLSAWPFAPGYLDLIEEWLRDLQP